MEKLSRALTVRFTPEINAELEKIAKIEQRPLSNLVLRFVSQGIEEYNKNGNSK